MRARALRLSAVLPVVSALALTLAAAPAGAQPPAQPPEPRLEAGVAPGAATPDPRPGEAFAGPELARLQRTAAEVQRELDDLAGLARSAQDSATEAAAELARAAAERRAADQAVLAQQQEVDDYSRRVFTAMGRPDQLRLAMTVDNPRDLLDGTSLVRSLTEAQDRRLLGAMDRQRAARDAESAAAGVERTAAERKADVQRREGDATNRADAVSAELTAPIDEANAAVVAQQRAQADRNAATAANWKAYTDRLAAAGISPPPASRLRDPAALPPGLSPSTGSAGAAQAGVAEATDAGERLLVLPEETVAAVTAGIAALGLPYVPGESGAGPRAYSCDGLVHAVYGGLGVPAAAAEQFATGVPVPPADVRPGDLVFLGPARYGVQSVGIVLDERTMLAADARLAGVVVTDLPTAADVLGASRPALGARQAEPVPARADGELTWRCGGVELPAGTRGAGGGAAVGPWGGFPNGLIPATALCPIGAGSHSLRCDAAQSFQALSQAYAGVFGAPVCVTDSYRTFDGQVDLYRRKPSLAAVPGTSNHGWGLAVDLCGGAESFGTAQHGWLLANARAFGWVHPGWARQGGGREEPWHWEFAGATG
ncbi:D-alanyl-D-alanine carboxypeptidase [Amycolatopsis antarctica]|uniref:D-alanyl-D-alanine carboxypeptidase n=1 Tax=Amycolatopsis antarctica TaxID=1854586 RepID=A0A263CX01_9PSEU|nr:D-alanyl-D-alanine carboxypeptidase family protein [Amycolatopsis antarctica]OZM70509.1 D-alanyl-D-alanine carboxypeptidase [Amycolatopsis antarctica]